ncbi:MAG TPA: hypothetical protein VD704_06030 [Gaiellaceae bacterium]|nr:hypothetical protein [Gaiellaceae bacterium]
MLRSTLTALLLALSLAAAGCGAGAQADEDGATDTTSTESAEIEAAPIAAQQIVQEFRRVSGGTRLQETAAPDASWDQLSLGLDVPPQLQRKFGTFSIYVVEAGNDLAVASLLADKDTAEPLPESADGIHWDFDELAGSYVAQKRYGANVVLTWWNERAEPGTDERWERLDAFMQELTRS